MAIRVKRVYEDPSGDDGVRVLVDRLWPRGFTKEAAGVDQWLKDVAPSRALCTWFGHDPAKWDKFKSRYFAELEAQGELVAELKKLARKGTLTLVYAAKDEQHNNAVALREYLRGR